PAAAQPEADVDAALLLLADRPDLGDARACGIRPHAVDRRVDVEAPEPVRRRLVEEVHAQIEPLGQRLLEADGDAARARELQILGRPDHRRRRRLDEHVLAGERIRPARIADDHLLLPDAVQPQRLFVQPRLVPVVEHAGAGPQRRLRQRLGRPRDAAARREVGLVVDERLQLVPQAEPDLQRLDRPVLVVDVPTGLVARVLDARVADALHELQGPTRLVRLEAREGEAARGVLDLVAAPAAELRLEADPHAMLVADGDLVVVAELQLELARAAAELRAAAQERIGDVDGHGVAQRVPRALGPDQLQARLVQRRRAEGREVGDADQMLAPRRVVRALRQAVLADPEVLALARPPLVLDAQRLRGRQRMLQPETAVDPLPLLVRR